MDLAFVSPAEFYATLFCSSLLSLFLARSAAWFNIETSWVPFDPHFSIVHTRSSLLLASWLVISVCFSLPCVFCPPTSPRIIFMLALQVYWWVAFVYAFCWARLLFCWGLMHCSWSRLETLNLRLKRVDVLSDSSHLYFSSRALRGWFRYAKNDSVTISGGTLRQDNCQLIGPALIGLARQAQKNRN